MARRRILTTTATPPPRPGVTVAACGGKQRQQQQQRGQQQRRRHHGGSGKVGVILPDTKSSARWEIPDRPQLEAAFKEAGVEYDIQNAEGDAASDADDRRPDDHQRRRPSWRSSTWTPTPVPPIERKAKPQGVKTIDYDRLTLGGVADYYVSFDNIKVGELQGKGLPDVPGRRGRRTSST